MSDDSTQWTTWPIKRFAEAFATAQIRIRNAECNATAGEGVTRVLAREAGISLREALSELPADVQELIRAITSKFDLEAPAVPRNCVN
jgi:hypothetical protein